MAEKAATSTVMMDGFGVQEMKELGKVTQDMATSYFAKPKEEGIADWLGAELKKYVPGNLIVGMVDDIQSSIADFNRNLAEVNTYCEEGKHKEIWLRNKLREPMEGMDAKAQGEYLTEVRDALSAGNMALAAAIESEKGVMIHADAILENVEETPRNSHMEWDRQTLGMMASDICSQMNLSAAAMAALPSGARMAMEAVEGASLAAESLADTGLDSDLDKGLKTIAAGALSVCSVTGRIPVLRDIATPVLTNIACVGVEGVKAFAKFGQGKISATKAIEHIEKAVTAGAVGLVRKGTELGKKLLSKIPVIGATIGTAVATVAGRMAEKKVGEYIHAGVEKIKPFARAAMETAKAAVTTAVATVKEVGKKVLSFFGF